MWLFLHRGGPPGLEGHATVKKHVRVLSIYPFMRSAISKLCIRQMWSIRRNSWCVSSTSAANSTSGGFGQVMKILLDLNCLNPPLYSTWYGFSSSSRSILENGSQPYRSSSMMQSGCPSYRGHHFGSGTQYRSVGVDIFLAVEVLP